jgi:PAS domain S-box-containing protein
MNKELELIFGGLLKDLDFVKALFEHMSHFSNSGIIITDKDAVIIEVNPAFSRLMGYSRDEIIGETPRKLLWSGHQDASFFKEMWDDIIDIGTWTGRIWDRSKSGKIFPVMMAIKKIELNENNKVYYAGLYNEILQIGEQEEPRNIKFYDENL